MAPLLSMKKEKNIKKIISIVFVSLFFAVGIMTVLTYFVRANFSLFIGLALCIIGLLTAHKSVVSEMEFKKYSGPDVLGGIAIVALGVTVMSQAMLGVIFSCFPILCGILGIWFLLDGLLSLTVHKKKEWIVLLLGVIYLSLSIWLIANMNFGELNVLLCGISLIAYSVYMLYKEFFSKEKDIKVEKVQEDYE